MKSRSEHLVRKFPTTKSDKLLAGAYLYGIVRNHAFLDGNKRTALAVSEVFLRRNGKRFVPPVSALYAMVMAAASPDIEDGLSDVWGKVGQR